MAKSLVIVESPAKARTISKYLGRAYQVIASVGHVKDLPKSKLGVDVDNDFLPSYVVIRGKAPVLKEIKAKAKAADKVYLAPDPDREGEAVAWHIAEELRDLKGTQVFRVLFNEITESSIKKALKSPGEIDLRKVNAQQARRVLDRVVGYQLSPLLWEKVRRGLSAGRVQSVAVRLVCEREREREAFQIKEYWTIATMLKGAQSDPFFAKLHSLSGETIEIATGEQADQIVEALKTKQFVVSDIEQKERKRNPLPPFITSRLQQDASRKLHFSPKRTMMLAQQLYEGVNIGEEGPVGLITYMRTDSTRIGDEATAEVRTLIGETFGSEYLPAKPPVYKTQKSAQEGHEAIRPTSAARTPDALKNVLDRDHFRLYELIWRRFVASQMMPARLAVTRVDIAAGEYLFRATGTQVIFAGHRQVYREGKDLDPQGAAQPGTEDDAENILPALATGDQLHVDGEGVTAKQHFTQPPPRYNEAILIRDLEEKGIGRPSTYASIVSTIQDRTYVEKEEGRMRPTELGTIVNDLLVEFFPGVLDVAFTAKMEGELDQIEEGQREWVETVREFYQPFAERLDVARVKMRNVKQEEVATDISCEKCGKPMVVKWGRFGRFLACSAYPECKSTKEFKEDASGAIEVVEKPEVATDETCEKCGSAMIIKTGRFGKFLACTAYPECKTTKAIGIGVKCPESKCGGDLVQKRTKKGRMFYACNRYPKCEFSLWSRPVNKPCPSCGATFLIEKARKQAEPQVLCRDTACGYTEPDHVPASA